MSFQGGRLSRCTFVDARQAIRVNNSATIEGCLLSNCEVAVSVPKEALGQVKLLKNALGLGVLDWGGQRIGAAQWDAFVQASGTTVAGNVVGVPKLDGPLYRLPDDSPLRPAGEFGAIVKENAGWQPAN